MTQGDVDLQTLCEQAGFEDLASEQHPYTGYFSYGETMYCLKGHKSSNGFHALIVAAFETQSDQSTLKIYDIAAKDLRTAELLGMVIDIHQREPRLSGAAAVRWLFEIIQSRRKPPSADR
ncbi:MAG: hypothetical protein HYT16_04440 [DPANN group archaeon]|nr:hypothetical protein [DPANN group archaeon]